MGGYDIVGRVWGLEVVVAISGDNSERKNVSEVILREHLV